MFGAQNSSDTGIIRQVLAGKPEAFGVLVDRYLAQVHAVAYSRVRNRADAEDAAQETFLQAYRSLSQLREPQKFAPWIVTIARRVASGMARRMQRSESRAEGTADAAPMLASSDVERREIHALLHEQIEQLDDDHREVLVLYYFTGQDTREIASALDISNDAAKKRLQRARLALGERIADKLGDALESERPAKDHGKQVMGAILALPKVAAISGAGASAGAGMTGGLLGAKGIAALTALVLVLAGAGISWVKWRPVPRIPSSRPGVLIAEASPTAAPSNATVTAPTAAPPAPAAALSAPQKSGDDGMGRGAGVVTGEVWNESDQPEPNVTVDLYRVNSRATLTGGRAIGHRTTQTDASGQFRFDNFSVGVVLAGGFEVVAHTANAVASSSFHLFSWEPEKDLLLGLAPAGAISGTVIDASGTALAGVTVTATHYLNTSAKQEVYAFSDVTDDQGAFTIPRLAFGSWRLTAEVDGYNILHSDPVPVGTKDALLKLGEGASISGRVVWADGGAPASGIRVLGSSVSEDRAATAVSDAAGAFTLRGFPDCVGVVSIRDNGWASMATPSVVHIAGGAGPADLVLPAGKGGAISGRMYDTATGRGIPGQYIFTMFCQTGDQTTSTGPDGVYRLDNIVGPCFVNGQVDKSWRGALVKPGEEFAHLDFPVRLEAKLRGVVVDQDGQPVSGALVAASQASSVRTGADGRFELLRYANLPESTWTMFKLTARKPGYGAAIVELDSSNLGEGGDTVLKLSPECSVSGIVKDRAGKPAMGVAVTLEALVNSAPRPVSADQKPVSWREIQGPDIVADTLPSGRYRFRGLGAGAYRVGMRNLRTLSPGANPSKEITVGPAQDSSGLELTLGGGELSISGSVSLSDGRPAARRTIGVDNAAGVSKVAYSDREGRYHVDGLEDGSYSLRVDSTVREVSAGATNVDIRLPDDTGSDPSCGLVEGRVVRADNGAPVTEFELAVRSKYWLQSNRQQGDFLLVRDPEGKFRYPYAFGKTDVVVRVPGQAETSVAVGTVTPEKPITGVVIRVEPGLVLTGRVVDSQGRPIADATVQADSVGLGGGEVGPKATSDAHGAFTIDSLGKKQIKLTARHPDYVEDVVEVAPAEKREIEIVLQTPGSIEGVVLSSGRPVQGALVQVFEARQAWPAVSTDVTGHFTVPKITAGEARVQAELKADDDAGSPPMTRTLSAVVEAGKVTPVDFNFGGDGCLVFGSVTVAGQTPPSGRVEARMQTATGELKQSSQLDASGRYGLDGLPAGTATLLVSVEVKQDGEPDEPHRMRNETITVEVPAAPRLSRNIDLGGAASVSGTVAGAGADTVGIVALVEGEQTLPDFSSGSFDSLQKLTRDISPLNGKDQFLFENVKAGKYTLVAVVIDKQYENDKQAFQHARISTAPVTAVDGREVVVKLAPK